MGLALLERDGDRWGITFYLTEDGRAEPSSRVVCDWGEAYGIVVSYAKCGALQLAARQLRCENVSPAWWETT